MLHLISQLGLPQAVVERVAAGDDVLLQQSNVWSAVTGHDDNHKLQYLLSLPCRVYVLQELLAVNGILPQQLLTGVQVTDYPGFVALTVDNPAICSWC